MEISSIQKRITSIEKLEAENKISKEMLKAELENDPGYMNARDTVKTATLRKKEEKERVMSSAPNTEIEDKIKENQEEITTQKEILTAELIDHYRKHNSDEIPDATGHIRRFKVSATLLPVRGE